ncbi:TraR/DksA family transcriptional regulator [Paludibaculum fermentans]|uniref:TraR/DksA family transcriptional regulator n=1 Tax=Paludibaculum fermentans TaxID=1473598 RepID=A0A7S7SMA5_PALFE|nr:TraR/DksA family transcriptional regulator [Paludibaculum fermentans]QOY88885.1 TraR/DksA family transcriptional regulator [Paludibaculum fermentans]
MKTLETLRPKEILMARARELERIVRSRDLAIEPVADPLDEIQQAADRELAIETADRASAKLAEIRIALDRLADGSYGICSDCDDDIAPNRLRAVPWASRCIRCQERFEDRGEVEEADFDDMPVRRKGLQDAA